MFEQLLSLLHRLYFSTYSGKTLFLILKYESCNSHMWMFIKPIFYFAVGKFVCTPEATTNIYGRKYRIQGQFSESQGKCFNQFASHLLGLSV